MNKKIPTMSRISVLFVCLGNICRSPTAHVVFESMVNAKGLADRIHVDSAGTGDWHLGKAPDTRSSATALERGYDMSHLKSRLVTSDDFLNFDYIIAMDSKNLADMHAMSPPNFEGIIRLILDHSQSDRYLDVREVPDPYYGGEDGFPFVVDLIEDASKGLLDTIIAELD